MDENLVWICVSRLGRAYVLLKDGEPVGTIEPADISGVIAWNNMGPCPHDAAG